MKFCCGVAVDQIERQASDLDTVFGCDLLLCPCKGIVVAAYDGEVVAESGQLVGYLKADTAAGTRYQSPCRTFFDRVFHVGKGVFKAVLPVRP